MSYLLLAAVIGFLLYLALRWFVSADPARIAFVAMTATLAVLAMVAMLLIFTGRVGSLYFLALLGGPLAMAWYRRRKAGQAGFSDASRPGASRKSRAESVWLQMELDVDGERLDGLIRKGAFAGRNLSALGESDLLSLYRVCQADPDSARLLEAYLDRRLGSSWREQGPGQGARAASADIADRDEALEILGLAPDASAEEIRAAHRRLMAQLHPDKGGSNYLAAKINRARDFLLGD